MKISSENIISKTQVQRDNGTFWEIVYTYEGKTYKTYKPIVQEKTVIEKEQEPKIVVHKKLSTKNKVIVFSLFLLCCFSILGYTQRQFILSTINSFQTQTATHVEKEGIKQEQIVEEKVIDNIVINEKIKLEVNKYYQFKQVNNLQIKEDGYKLYKTLKQLVLENYGEYYGLYLSEEKENLDTKRRETYVFIKDTNYQFNFSKINPNIESISTIQKDIVEYKRIKTLGGEVFKVIEYVDSTTLDQITHVENITDMWYTQLRSILLLSDSIITSIDKKQFLSQYDRKYESKKKDLDEKTRIQLQMTKELIVRQTLKSIFDEQQ